jgi:hypothetical protein
LAIVAVALFITATAGSAPGCRARSVNETKYVAANRVILDKLPAYPGAGRTNTYSIPQVASDSCVPTDTGPPYEAYWTWDTYTLPRKGRRIVSAPWKDYRGGLTRAPLVLVYYDRKLRERGWKRQAWSGCCEVAFKRGTALLAVRVGLNLKDPYKRPPFSQLGLDHGE